MRVIVVGDWAASQIAAWFEQWLRVVWQHRVIGMPQRLGAVFEQQRHRAALRIGTGTTASHAKAFAGYHIQDGITNMNDGWL
jgi:hypothetical protein